MTIIQGIMIILMKEVLQFDEGSYSRLCLKRTLTGPDNLST